MTEPSVPSPSPAKKGLSPLAWVAIGCGGLIVVGGLILLAVIGFAGYKAKQFVEGMEERPVTTLAKTIAFANPEIEFVEADEEARRATFRNKETGETFTIDAEDLEQGRFSFETSEGKVTFGAEGDGEGGTLTVTDGEGSTVYRGGAGSAADVPGWVPVYPGGAVEGAYSAKNAQGEQGAFTVTTEDGLEEVEAYYREELESAGYEVESTSFEMAGLTQKSLSGRGGDAASQITVIIRRGEQTGVSGTQAVVQYSRGDL